MSTEFINDQWRLPNEENKSKVSNYSMDFLTTTRIPDITGLGLGTSVDTFSISLWFNKSNMNYGIVFSTYSGTGSYITSGVAINLYTDGTIGLYNGAARTTTSAQYSINTWYNLVVTSDGTTVKMYVNGSQVTLNSTTAVARDFTNVWINSAKYSASNFGIVGKIDGVAIFDYALSSSQITTLYGSSSTGIGNPMSLSPKPVAFYQLGDKSAFNGANYLVPNIAAEEADGDIAASFSPYALDFDSASSDYIQIPKDSTLSFVNTDFSISIWLNPEVSHNGLVMMNYYGSAGWGVYYQSGSIRFFDSLVWTTVTTINTNEWTHILIVGDYTGSNLLCYKNGVEVYNSSHTFSITDSNRDVFIGSERGAGFFFNGKLSNVSIWNTDLTSAQVTEIYNEGVPSNLNNHSAYSNLVSWWQLGSNSSFNTNWTVLDEKGSNNGTSSNMGEDAIVDGVGSYANGLSSGMGGDEVIGDAPYSTANSLSVNMDVEDRVTDTPS